MLGGMLFFANIFSVNPIDNKIGVSFFLLLVFRRFYGKQITKNIKKSLEIKSYF